MVPASVELAPGLVKQLALVLAELVVPGLVELLALPGVA